MSDSKIDALRRKKAKLYLGGGEKRIAKQHAAGKRTARERLAQLFDQDTFQETHPFMQHRCVDFGMEGRELPGEGVVASVQRLRHQARQAVSSAHLRRVPRAQYPRRGLGRPRLVRQRHKQ